MNLHRRAQRRIKDIEKESWRAKGYMWPGRKPWGGNMKRLKWDWRKRKDRTMLKVV